jgi:hypothetical protein
MLIDEILMEDFDEIDSDDDDLYGYFYDTEMNKYIIHIPNNQNEGIAYFTEYDDIKYDKKVYYKNKFYKNMNYCNKFHNFDEIVCQRYDNSKIEVFNIDQKCVEDKNKYTKKLDYYNIKKFIITNIISIFIILILSFEIWYIL